MTRFAGQLEYRLDEEWAEVVRFDYDPEGEQGHDVTTDGVHMDVYRDGEKVRSPEIFPPMARERRAHERRRTLDPARWTIHQEV